MCSAIERTVLVTGAAGVIGQALLPVLNDHRVIALQHTTAGEALPHVTWIRGDISRPRLGLARDDFAALAGQVDAVVHAAAVTDLAADPALIRQVNVTGTETVLNFAERAGATVYFVDSAFAARAETCTAVTGIGCAAGRDAYLASKIASADLVRRSGLEHVILRLSLLMGDSRSGRIARRQGMHSVLGAYCLGDLPFLPLEAAALIDMVPQDMLVEAIRRLVDGHDGELSTREYWLTVGPAAITVGRMFETAREVMAGLGRRLDSPRYFPVETMLRLVRPAFFDILKPRARRRLDDLLAMASMFSGSEPFPTSLGNPPLQGLEITEELSRAVIARTVRRYWAPAHPQEREVVA